MVVVCFYLPETLPPDRVYLPPMTKEAVNYTSTAAGFMDSSAILERHSSIIFSSSNMSCRIFATLSVKSLIQLLDDFLSIDKLEHGEIQTEKKVLDLYNFIREITDSLETALKDGQDIYYSYTGSKVVCTEPNMLNNILLNLLSNAIKYSDNAITVDVEADTQFITISISDKGIGIPEEEIERLFTKHFRASNVGVIKGTGLGLNIVRHYVRLLNGSIRATSKRDIGTTFTLQLPNESSVNL